MATNHPRIKEQNMTATKAELEALKLAIETEQKGYDFFKKARGHGQNGGHQGSL
jgi:hypothetical protein